MKSATVYKWLNYCIAFVWFINGFFCKMLNLVPRHKEIVGRILNTDQTSYITFLIGSGEVLMAIWILLRIRPGLNAITQIILIAIMNTLEFILAPDLLLWGKLNSVFATLFIILIGYNEFYLNKKLTRRTSWLHL